MPVYPVMNTDVTLWYLVLTYSWAYKCDHIWDFRQIFLQFHFLHPSYVFAISLLEKAEEITLLPSVCLQTFPYISWLAIKYLIIIFDDLLFAMILLWISSLQSAHLHREHIWHQMNQNVEIGSLPICFSLLDNLFVFV